MTTGFLLSHGHCSVGGTLSFSQGHMKAGGAGGKIDCARRRELKDPELRLCRSGGRQGIEYVRVRLAVKDQRAEILSMKKNAFGQFDPAGDRLPSAGSVVFS